MDISIVIVNWNSLEFTKECIASIEADTHEVAYEIIVVDNASSDDCRVLLDRSSNVQLIRSETNLGFARANNLGFERSSGRMILFLNPDTVVKGDALKRMATYLDQRPEFGALGCKLLNADLTLQTSCVQPFPTITNQLLTLEYFKRRWPGLSLWGMRALFSESGGVSEVEAVSGACLMARRDILDTVGGFSTEYFMYAEELDLCCKIRRAGSKIGYVGEAEVIHFGGQSSQQRGDGFSDVVMRESVYRLLKKFRGSPYALLYRGALLASAVARLVVLASLRLAPGGLVEKDSILRAFTKWRKIASWSLALESWVRELGRPSASTAVKI